MTSDVLFFFFFSRAHSHRWLVRVFNGNRLFIIHRAVCGNIIISAREREKGGKRFPVLLRNREESPNWICLTAGSVGRGRLMPVSPCGAVPGFIRPFTSTQTNLGQRTSSVEQMGISGTFFCFCFWLCRCRHAQSNTDQFLSRTSDRPRCASGGVLASV